MNNLKQIQQHNLRKIITSEYPEYSDFCKSVEKDCASYADCEKWIKVEDKPITLDRVF